ncbi:50S ribosomal protein L18 [Candidatus Woesearchaeota archaeon]|nr:50S ribosomal protein L18 [Candidatus Woesearchaeota archaeon]
MKSTIAVQFARKLSGRTNYRRRLSLLKSNRPRLVVRKTLSRIIMQVVNFDAGGDKVIIAASSDTLKKLGWGHSGKNIPAAYLAGMLLGKMALAAKISEVTPDIGLQSVTKGGKIFAALKGAKDAGLNFELSQDVVPSSDAISGAKIAAYAKSAKAGGAALIKITEDFEKVRAAISGGRWNAATAKAAAKNANKNN